MLAPLFVLKEIRSLIKGKASTGFETPLKPATWEKKRAGDYLSLKGNNKSKFKQM